MLKISIPSPCHEDWDTMSPNHQGRHCNSCAKTVIDFTRMSDEEVKYFLINKKEEKLCGRFTNKQLEQISIQLPQNIFQLQLPFWKQFLVASLLVFSTTLFSCAVNTKGEVVSLNNASAVSAVIKPNSVDTIPENIIGGLDLRSVRTRSQPNRDTVCHAIMGDTVASVNPPPRPEIMGKVAFVEPVKDSLYQKLREISVVPKNKQD